MDEATQTVFVVDGDSDGRPDCVSASGRLTCALTARIAVP